NFTNPVSYMVTAADGTTAVYTVTIAIASSTAKAITAYSFTNPGATGTINESAKTISVTVPYGTDVSVLVATFSTTGPSVNVGATVQVSGATPNNFTNPVSYMVTAADGTIAEYMVTVTMALMSTMTPTTGSIQVVEGEVGQLAFTVTVTGAASNPIVPVVNIDQPVLAMQGAVDTSVANQYTIHLTTPSTLEPGAYQGEISFRLCSDATCSTVYAGGQQSFAYTVTVTLSDWATFQRDESHTGFVNAQLDPARFAKIWTWSRPAGDPEPIGGINSVATGAGKVFVAKDIYFGQGALYALNEADGTVSWTYSLGPMASEGPPAFANGSVYVPSTDQAENCVIWAVDAALGTYQFKMPSTCQWSNFFAPTAFGGSVLHTSQAGVVYSYSTANGSLQWSAPAGAYDQTTPAVDAQYAYQYGSSSGSPVLDVFDRTTGASVASISDPFSTGFSGYSMFSAPMLGASGDAVVFSGGGFSGRAASSSEQYDSRVLVSYNVAGKAYAWRSANAYLTHPAIANGVIYAARNAPAALDALSEADGHVLWSWTPPTGNISFHRNIVVTRNLVFVSTDANVYAIDLSTHQSVWQYDQPGMLAISGNSTLYITTGATISDGHLVAIKLK
ncbi:MAG: PQQ-binding-like beta-propeller repeat protein, partial [Methanothrix sp.]|nr:PQQ-binding-like beta-propeller repeat protein [Methanothrix sp.]